MTNKERKAKQRKNQRKTRSRARIFGTTERPRLHVYRSLRHMSVQLIDDTAGKTLISMSSRTLKDTDKKNKTDIATLLGQEVAKLAQSKQITTVVFDRSGYKYHGRVKALAEGARAIGLDF